MVLLRFIIPCRCSSSSPAFPSSPPSCLCWPRMEEYDEVKEQRDARRAAAAAAAAGASAAGGGKEAMKTDDAGGAAQKNSKQSKAERIGLVRK